MGTEILPIAGSPCKPQHAAGGTRLPGASHPILMPIWLRHGSSARLGLANSQHGNIPRLTAGPRQGSGHRIKPLGHARGSPGQPAPAPVGRKADGAGDRAHRGGPLPSPFAGQVRAAGLRYPLCGRPGREARVRRRGSHHRVEDRDAQRPRGVDRGSPGGRRRQLVLPFPVRQRTPRSAGAPSEVLARCKGSEERLPDTGDQEQGLHRALRRERHLQAEARRCERLAVPAGRRGCPAPLLDRGTHAAPPVQSADRLAPVREAVLVHPLRGLRGGRRGSRLRPLLHRQSLRGPDRAR